MARARTRRYKPTFCVDFDGVIHDYQGWKGATVIDGAAVPGAFDFLARMQERYRVLIFSTRCESDDAVAAMKQWMKDQGCPELVVEKLHFHMGGHKPKAVAYLDDRAIRFEGAWPSLEDIEAKPWNRR